MKSNKIWSLLIIIVLGTSAMLMTKPAYAATNPSVPQFTLQYVDHSYDIPPTYGIDPYTGKTIVTNYGSHVDNRTIDVTIINQPFTPYLDSQNNTVQLYYNIRCKGHFVDWNISDPSSHSMNGLQASTSTYTVVSFDIAYWNIAPGGQIDFQVEAVTGYTYYNSGYCGEAYQTTVGDSGWSNTETITIDNSTVTTGTTTPTQTPTPAPTILPNSTATNPPYQNPTVTNLPTQTPYQYPASTPIQVGASGGAPFGFGFDWQVIALIVMAAVIAVLVGILVAVLKWRRVAAAK